MTRMVQPWVEDSDSALQMIYEASIERCEELGLRATGPKQVLIQRVSLLITARTMRYTQRIGRWFPV